MLSDKPKGVIFGKDVNTNKYVVKDEKADGNVMILGGTGSGKSSCFILDYLVQKDKKAACFVIDIKGELSFKSTMYGIQRYTCLIHKTDTAMAIILFIC